MSYDTAPTTQDITQATPAVESSIQENANMIQGLFSKIVSKAIEGTDLAARVAELERQLGEAKAAIETLRSELALEKTAHEGTARELQNVQAKLAAEQNAVHDLVQERDIVIEERNGAQRERDRQRVRADQNKEWAEQVESLLGDERQRNHVLEERLEHMTQKVGALKEALQGLHQL